jgi:hypothetical protein
MTEKADAELSNRALPGPGSDLPPEAISVEDGFQKGKKKDLGLSFKLPWQLYWLAPNLLTGFLGDSKATQAKRDEVHNSRSRVPAEQGLQSPMIWGVELYGPGEIEDLYRSLKALKWFGIGAGDFDADVAEVVQRTRSHGGGAHLNLGYVFRHGSRKPSLLAKNFASLPDGVDALKVEVFQITDSMTAVLVGFSLLEPLTNAYERELNRDRNTYHRRMRRKGIQSLDPINQKIAAVHSTRSQLRAMVGTWFTNNLPGYFSNLGQPALFPTMELVAGNGSAFVEAGHSLPRYESWQRLLFNVSAHEVWSDERKLALRLAFLDGRDEHQGLHIFASLDNNIYKAANPVDTNFSLCRDSATYCHDEASGILVQSATLQYLKEHMRDLNRTRERMKHARSGKRSTSRTIDEIGRFFDRNIGFPAVARDLARHSKLLHSYQHACGRFATKYWHDDKTYFLSDSIQQRLQSLSMQLTEEEASIRGHFEQVTNILSVRESVKAQKRMERLTVVALVVALCSLAAALPKWERVAAVLQGVWSSIKAVAT